MKSESAKYDIQLYSDGRPSEFISEFGLDLDQAVEELIYYDQFSEQYSEEEMRDYLEGLKPGYVMRGSRWAEFKITKKISHEVI